MSTNQAFPPPTPGAPAPGAPNPAAPSPGAATRSASRRGLTVGLAAGLLGGTAAGLVFGVPGLTSATGGPTPALIEQVTDPATDPAEQPADTDRAARLRERLQPLVDDGTITVEQADAVAAQLAEDAPHLDYVPGGDERRPGGRFGAHVGGPFGRGAGVVSEVVTDLLNLDADELRTQLRDGSTLAEIATAQGVEPQAVIDELVAELDERLDAAVENGRIDQATADEKLADAEARITDMVNNGLGRDFPDAPDAQDTPETPETPETED